MKYKRHALVTKHLPISEFPTHHIGISLIPVIITHGTREAIVRDLYNTLRWAASSDQTH